MSPREDLARQRAELEREIAELNRAIALEQRAQAIAPAPRGFGAGLLVGAVMVTATGGMLVYVLSKVLSHD